MKAIVLARMSPSQDYDFALVGVAMDRGGLIVVICCMR
jgi:hypothetical protein